MRITLLTQPDNEANQASPNGKDAFWHMVIAQNREGGFKVCCHVPFFGRAY